MAITLWEEVAGTDGRIGDDGLREYTRNFFAVTDDPKDTPVHVMKYRDCPKPREAHPVDLLSRVSGVLPVERKNEPGHWDVEVHYSSIMPKEQDENPLARPADIHVGSHLDRVPFTRTWDGKPVVNTAGDYIHGLTKDVSRWVITVKKNLPKLPAWLATYADSINNNDIRIKGLTWPKHTLRLAMVNFPEAEEENNVVFYPFRFELFHDPDGWKPAIPSRGFYELIPEPGQKKKHFFTPTNFKRRRILIGNPPEEPAEPQFLDKFGRYIPAGLVDGTQEDKRPEAGIDPLTVHMLHPEAYRPMDYTKLPLK